jgi:hypothetical protein
VLSHMSKAAVEQIERFFSFPQLPARSKRAISAGSSTMKAPRQPAPSRLGLRPCQDYGSQPLMCRCYPTCHRFADGVTRTHQLSPVFPVDDHNLSQINGAKADGRSTRAMPRTATQQTNNCHRVTLWRILAQMQFPGLAEPADARSFAGTQTLPRAINAMSHRRTEGGPEKWKCPVGRGARTIAL